MAVEKVTHGGVHADCVDGPKIGANTTRKSLRDYRRAIIRRESDHVTDMHVNVVLWQDLHELVLGFSLGRGRT